MVGAGGLLLPRQNRASLEDMTRSRQIARNHLEAEKRNWSHTMRDLARIVILAVAVGGLAAGALNALDPDAPAPAPIVEAGFGWGAPPGV